MRTSDEGLTFLRTQEYDRPVRNAEGLHIVYADTAGIATIGPGLTHYANGTPVTFADPPMNDTTLDREFRAVVMQTEAAVDDAVLVDLTQNQFDALVSLNYNIGPEAFHTSTLVRKLNRGDFSGAALEFSKWNKETVNGKRRVNNGLVRRRARELTLFLRGTPSGAGNMPQGDIVATRPLTESREVQVGAWATAISALGGIATGFVPFFQAHAWAFLVVLAGLGATGVYFAFLRNRDGR